MRLLAILGILLPLALFADEPVNAELAKEADVVVRAKRIKPGIGSRYWWATIEILEVYKMPKDLKLDKRFEVAHESVGRKIPPGVSTLYLVRYNADRPKDGWKLLEKNDPKTQGLLPGYSHSESEEKANQSVERNVGPTLPLRGWFMKSKLLTSSLSTPVARRPSPLR